MNKLSSWIGLFRALRSGLRRKQTALEPDHDNTRVYNRPMWRFVRIIALVPVLMMMDGCHRTLFSENAPRTQFELHEQTRRSFVPLEERDVFGKPQPALRARLARPY